MNTVICIASGPSLTQEDVNKCERSGLPILVVNNAFERVADPDFHYAGDTAWWREHYFKTHTKSRKFSIRANDNDQGHLGVIQVERRKYHDECFSDEWPVLCTGKNSGYQAINLVYLLGFKRAILLGYDMQFTNGRKHCHEDHRYSGARNPEDHTVRSWQRIFNKMAPTIMERIEVLNATRETALECFPRVDLDRALRDSVLPEHRCPRCNKLLYKGEVMEIEIKCPRCKYVVYHQILDLRNAIKRQQGGMQNAR